MLRRGEKIGIAPPVLAATQGEERSPTASARYRYAHLGYDVAKLLPGNSPLDTVKTKEKRTVVLDTALSCCVAVKIFEAYLSIYSYDS